AAVAIRGNPRIRASDAASHRCGACAIVSDLLGGTVRSDRGPETFPTGYTGRTPSETIRRPTRSRNDLGNSRSSLAEAGGPCPPYCRRSTPLAEQGVGRLIRDEDVAV